MSESDNHFPILELRRYAMQPGQRDALADPFDHEFIAELESLPMRVIGQFRDVDDADLWVWMRAFRNHRERAESLTSFYTSPFWLQRRQRVNATLISSDDVHLLVPAWPGSALGQTGTGWPVDRSRAAEGALYVQIMPLPEHRSMPDLRAAWESLMADHQARAWACYVSDNAPNSYPRLPVHEGRQVLVVFALFATLATLDQCLADDLSAHLFHWAGVPAERTVVAPWQGRHRLLPTGRSALRA
ncbi:NIPSNAP family protein [Ahniella affigens]|nr:NIPSNAP family protein [Ahniella affigens]